MSKKYTNFDDISALHDELKSEIAADKIYWIRNDAKIRAVTSSRNYDEFRDIVNAAHLQPIGKPDKAPKKCSWNKVLNN